MTRKIIIIIICISISLYSVSQNCRGMLGYYGGTKSPIGFFFGEINDYFGYGFNFSTSLDAARRILISDTVKLSYEVRNGVIHNVPDYIELENLYKTEHLRFHIELALNFMLFGNPDDKSVHLYASGGIGLADYIYKYNEYVYGNYRRKVFIIDKDKSTGINLSMGTGLIFNFDFFILKIGMSTIHGGLNTLQLNFGVAFGF